MPIIRSKRKHSYGSIQYQGKEYKLKFGHPVDMLSDKNISWESKGYLSAIAFSDQNCRFSYFVINDLIQNGYLVEVVK